MERPRPLQFAGVFRWPRPNPPQQAKPVGQPSPLNRTIPTSPYSFPSGKLQIQRRELGNYSIGLSSKERRFGEVREGLVPFGPMNCNCFASFFDPVDISVR